MSYTCCSFYRVALVLVLNVDENGLCATMVPLQYSFKLVLLTIYPKLLRLGLWPRRALTPNFGCPIALP